MWPDLQRNGGTGLDGISDSRSKLDRKTGVVAPVVAAERVFDELPVTVEKNGMAGGFGLSQFRLSTREAAAEAISGL